MARPKKKGLDYFPLDADFFSDKKIKILKARYGADGIAIYIYLLCEIYKNGFYIKVDDDFQYIMSDDLGMSVDKVKQVLTFLLERSLFDNILFQSDAVLTSAGIQKRFQLAVKERAKKNPIQIPGFWLLKKEETEPFIKFNLFEGMSENNGSYSGKNSNNSPEESLKESKVKKYIYYANPELENYFSLFIQMRNSNEKESLTKEQVSILKEELDQLAKSDKEKIAIVKKAFASNWKSFYPVKKKSAKTEKPQKKNQFQNFDEREYDFEKIEAQLFEQQIGGNHGTEELT